MEKKNCRMKIFYRLTILVILAVLSVTISACSSVEKVRKTTDMIVANGDSLNLNALVQAEMERKRLRKLRCHSPLLNPTAISGAASHPSLGRDWVDELLRDCPEYSAFIAEIVLHRAEGAGIEVLKAAGEHTE